MLKLDLAFCFSTYYFGLFIKQNAGLPTVVRVNQVNQTHLRVINGQDIENSEYPFAVVLFLFDEICEFGVCRFCTASMITESWVITAAHCVDGLQDIKTYLWYGNYTVPPSESKLFSSVLEIIVHPGYHHLSAYMMNVFIADNDISLFRVDPISLRHYGRLSSVDHTTLIGLPVTYIGAGETDKPGDDNTRLLQLGEGAVVTCDAEFKDLNRYLICVSSKCSTKLDTPGKGDSGGPLLYNERIIGVASYTQTLETLVYYGYAPVSPYIDWIYEVTRPK